MAVEVRSVVRVSGPPSRAVPHLREVTATEATRLRAAHHSLEPRKPARDLAAVAGAMGGAQAQMLSAAALSLGVRTLGLTPSHVEKALWEDRSLALSWNLRATLHLVPAKDLALFARGSARRWDREIQWFRGKGLSIPKLDRLLDQALAELDSPRTVAAFAAGVARTSGVPVRVRRGGGWGSRSKVPCVPFEGITIPATYLLRIVGSRGVICRGPDEGGSPTFVRADAWLRPWRDRSPDSAEEELLERYLRAFAPATVEDFTAWTGLRLSDARAIWGRRSEAIETVSYRGRAAGMLRSEVRYLSSHSLPGASIRLLPHFDGYLMGHRARDHLMDPQHHPRVSRPAGWIAPSVLDDGKIVGTWSMESAHSILRVRVGPFHAPDRRLRGGVELEADHIARFLGLQAAEVAFGPVGGPLSPGESAPRRGTEGADEP